MPAEPPVKVPCVGGPLGGTSVRMYGDVEPSWPYRGGRYQLCDGFYEWHGDPDLHLPRTCGSRTKLLARCGKPGKAVVRPLEGMAVYVCGVHANIAEKRGWTVIRYDVKKKTPSASEDYT